jgi:hypothetical protein
LLTKDYNWLIRSTIYYSTSIFLSNWNLQIISPFFSGHSNTPVINQETAYNTYIKNVIHPHLMYEFISKTEVLALLYTFYRIISNVEMYSVNWGINLYSSCYNSSKIKLHDNIFIDNKNNVFFVFRLIDKC